MFFRVRRVAGNKALPMKRAIERAALSLAICLGLLSGPAARAQNAISQDGWEGFATRDVANRFDRCILYNRTIQALGASPYEMLGLTRDAAGHVGLLIFFSPRTLTRGENEVQLKFDETTTLTATGQALSDFHVNVAALDADALAALRGAKSIEARVEGRTIRFDLSGVSAALDRLEACVKTYEPKG
jgi:hypothetical protein